MLPNYGNHIRMTLAELSHRTKIDTRRMRYALEYKLIPNAAKASKGRGSERQFSNLTSFFLTLAALMLDAGLRRPLIKSVISDMADFILKSKGNLDFDICAPEPGRAFIIEIADGTNRRAGSAIDEKTPWRQIRTGAQVETAYKPLAIIRFDIAHLANLLFSSGKM
jgi:hypothetical protein